MWEYEIIQRFEGESPERKLEAVKQSIFSKVFFSEFMLILE